MSYEILIAPDPRLHRRCTPVADPTALAPLALELRLLVEKHNAAGLAAPQVGEAVRLFVLAATVAPRAVFINPRLIAAKHLRSSREGCLSIPGVTALKKRYAEVEVEAWDERGERFRLTLTGLGAVAVQHELDHLNGRLMTD